MCLWAQQIEIELSRETYPDELNVAFTRGFVSSQAFVDQTHLGALEANGSTVIVLAEGISHLRQKRVFHSTHFDADNVLALSQFLSSQSWTAGAAMTRNGVIAALSNALLVIEARQRGGTLNAGMQALQLGRPLLHSTLQDLPEGNRLLFERGAQRLRTQRELFSALDWIASGGEPEQLHIHEGGPR